MPHDPLYLLYSTLQGLESTNHQSSLNKLQHVWTSFYKYAKPSATYCSLLRAQRKIIVCFFKWKITKNLNDIFFFLGWGSSRLVLPLPSKSPSSSALRAAPLPLVSMLTVILKWQQSSYSCSVVTSKRAFSSPTLKILNWVPIIDSNFFIIVVIGDCIAKISERTNGNRYK